MIFVKKLGITFIFIILFGCATPQESNNLESLGINTFEIKDVAYGSHREQKLDIYLPTKKSGPYPVMFQVHGGAWHWGDKSENEYSIEDYRNQGFAVVNINYRMGNMSNTLVEKLDDIKSALDFIYQYQEEWNLSDDLTLVGGSAGGHMVLQYGFTLGYNQVDRIISYSGPTDLTNPYYEENNLLYNINALFRPSNPTKEMLMQASPLFSIPDEPGPAVMMIHGNADEIVDFKDSKELHQALLNAGWDSSLIEIPNADHSYNNTDWGWVSSIFQPWLDKQVWE